MKVVLIYPHYILCGVLYQSQYILADLVHKSAKQNIGLAGHS